MDIFAWLFPRASQPADPETEAAIGCLLQIIDPRLKALSGISKRLAPVVRAALDFCGCAIEAMPGPLDASLPHWREAPELRVLFTRNDEVQRIFSHQEVVRDYVDSHPGAACFYALLGAAFEERKSFGSIMKNGVARHDVAITSLNFKNHRLFLPRMRQTTFEYDLRWALFRQLALEMLGRLSAMKEEQSNWREEIAFLRAQLAYSGQQGLGNFLADESASDAGMPNDLAHQLLASQSALRTAHPPLQSLENTLEWIIETLSAPDALLHMQNLDYRVDKANQVIAAEEEGLDVHLRHFAVTAPTPRSGVLLRIVYPSDELLPRRQMATDLDRLYL
ncbi:hypothetical protein AGMMS49545_08030 [Betaproteobacteria bacterium]|nr:hypothetical protein AGMMS49545_08030 [Betaproteobacteria bacterium]GHU42829.1 hypothetical protein AGMMS50289_08210 [Betaproteobacteria bacterium]